MRKLSWAIIIIAFTIVIGVLSWCLYEVIDYSNNQMIVITLDYGDDVIESKELKVGSSISINSEPTKDAYTFGGWYTDKECTNVYDFNNPAKENLTLYAKWIPNS